MMDILDINNDGTIDIDDIYEIIIRLMKTEKKNKLISGYDKKINVLNQIRAVYGSVVYSRYEPFINKTIDFLHTYIIKNKCYKKILCCTNIK
jgi:hypothetical protein